MVKRTLVKQIGIILLTVLLFAAFNLSIYKLLSSRLTNNFGSAATAKMIDVGSYLPHDRSSDLPNINATLKLESDLPVLDGAAALLPVYAAVIHNVYPEGCVKFVGGEFSDDNFYGENFAPDSAMQYKNTVRGYKAIVDGETDIFFSAAPSKEQRAYAEEKGVTLTYVPIGLEAFVFFVNKNNPVDSLTAEQIRDIYACKYTNWSQVGGADRVINPVTRLKGSGSQTTFEKFMGERQIGRKSPLAITGGGIGFSFRYYFSTLVGDPNVKLLSVNGVYPDEGSISDGSYPLVSQFYAVYRSDNENSNVKALVNWLLSDEGQTLIAQSGYVKIK